VEGRAPSLGENHHLGCVQWDRSENGDYIYGKKRLREIDRRVRFLRKRLELAEVVDPRSAETAIKCFSVRR